MLVLYTVEFQKRGLPHIHCLVWLAANDANVSAAVIDGFISAEIPDIETDELAYELVSEFMMHGPCGKENKKCPCMKDDKCSKHYPKDFQDETFVDECGFTVYRRRNDGRSILKSGIRLDNRSVVPYNIHLLKKFQAHINVEWCNKSNMIKYLFKYIMKGQDKAKIYFETTAPSGNMSPNHDLAPPDEILEYMDARFLSACEALHRIFEFDIHYRVPPVERLAVHLPGMNYVRYEYGSDLRAVLNSPAAKRTMLTEWFETNTKYEEARNLTYCDFPKEWTWDASSRTWHKRTRAPKIGRMYYVHPASGELYYLRMLLMIVTGAQSYSDIRTYNGVVYETYRECCEARGILEGDNEWHLLFDEAIQTASAYQLRQLFVTVVLFCSVGNVCGLFDKYWLYMTDDIHLRLKKTLDNPHCIIPHEHILTLLIHELTIVFGKSGGNIRDYNLPLPTFSPQVPLGNRLLDEELSLDPLMMSMHANSLIAQLNDDQKIIFDVIVNRVASDEPGFFLLVAMVVLVKRFYGMRLFQK